MKMSLTERRQIENEMIFRRANEKIGASLDETDDNHMREKHPWLTRDDLVELQFKCECSDETCHARISIKLSTYQKIHLNRDVFIIKLKHQVEAIEKVILTEKTYAVVEKNKSTTDPGESLNTTTINNT